MNLWNLPRAAVIGGREYAIHSDFREVLRVIACLNCADYPAYIRWRVALGLFYDGEIPPKHRQAAMEYLADFLTCGERDTPSRKWFDWEADAAAILSDVNKAAGREVRQERFLHWWTFLSYFNAIGEGQFSTLLTVREKLRQGLPLGAWEQEYYRDHPRRVSRERIYTREERQRQEALKRILDGGKL